MQLIKLNLQIIEQGLKKALSTGTWGMNKSKKGVARTLLITSQVRITRPCSSFRGLSASKLNESSGKDCDPRFIQ
jgi:hypothetical protein